MSDTPLGKFQGFDEPQENWSKLPHALIESLPLMTSEAEIKIVLYILRHTWGFKDDQKKITIDEFCNGRKRKDGSRFDSGVGLTANAVKAGIRNAIEHGFIEVTEDARDKARIKRYYHLRGSNSGGQTLTPRPSDSDPLESESDPRSEKETSLKETHKKIQEEPAPKVRHSDFQKVCTSYQYEIGGLSQIISDTIDDDLRTYPADWIIEAMKRAALANKRSYTYVGGILRNWKACGGPQNDKPKSTHTPKGHPLNGNTILQRGETAPNGNGPTPAEVAAAFKARCNGGRTGA